MWQAFYKKIDLDPNNIQADTIKVLLFKYFRFKRGLHCTTETDVFYRDIEDFVAFNDKEIYCVEIKTDKTDFLNDFKTKQKHKNPMKYDKFYFCVPMFLADFVIEYLKNYPKYGLIVIGADGLKVKKNAKQSNKSNMSAAKYRYLLLRMSSELANEKIMNLRGAK